jgi:hypothetical protein
MKAFRIIMRVLSLTLLASALICGLWLARRGQAGIDPGSLQFHMAIGIAGIVCSAVTMFLPGGKARQKMQ